MDPVRDAPGMTGQHYRPGQVVFCWPVGNDSQPIPHGSESGLCARWAIRSRPRGIRTVVQALGQAHLMLAQNQWQRGSRQSSTCLRHRYATLEPQCLPIPGLISGPPGCRRCGGTADHSSRTQVTTDRSAWPRVSSGSRNVTGTASHMRRRSVHESLPDSAHLTDALRIVLAVELLGGGHPSQQAWISNP